MDAFIKIINQRSVPGTLIFDFDNRLLFINKEALELIRNQSPAPGASAAGRIGIPRKIFRLCDEIKENGGNGTPPETGGCGILLRQAGGFFLSARAFLLDRGGEKEKANHIMILLERVIEKHKINLAELTRRFPLSLREVEVVGLVCEGYTNREIGKKLFISEHTVKDHVKNIMKKMNVATRNEIVAVLI